MKNKKIFTAVLFVIATSVAVTALAENNFAKYRKEVLNGLISSDFETNGEKSGSKDKKEKVYNDVIKLAEEGKEGLASLFYSFDASTGRRYLLNDDQRNHNFVQYLNTLAE